METATTEEEKKPVESSKLDLTRGSKNDNDSFVENVASGITSLWKTSPFLFILCVVCGMVYLGITNADNTIKVINTLKGTEQKIEKGTEQKIEKETKKDPDKNTIEILTGDKNYRTYRLNSEN